MGGKTCRKCKFVRSGINGNLYCMWEKETLPPAVVRQRLSGRPDPQTWDEFAEKCAYFEDTTP